MSPLARALGTPLAGWGDRLPDLFLPPIHHQEIAAPASTVKYLAAVSVPAAAGRASASGSGGRAAAKRKCCKWTVAPTPDRDCRPARAAAPPVVVVAAAAAAAAVAATAAAVAVILVAARSVGSSMARRQRGAAGGGRRAGRPGARTGRSWAAAVRGGLLRNEGSPSPRPAGPGGRHPIETWWGSSRQGQGPAEPPSSRAAVSTAASESSAGEEEAVEARAAGSGGRGARGGCQCACRGRAAKDFEDLICPVSSAGKGRCRRRGELVGVGGVWAILVCMSH